jgi:hypothetical protein
MPLFIKAQDIVQDITGKPLMETSYTDVQGSPYLTDFWVNGLVKLSNGKTISNINLKYDQVADELLFENKEHQALSFVDQVSEFKLIYGSYDKPVKKLFRNGFQGVDNGNQNSFYEVLADGGSVLLKKARKKITEIKPYNSSTTVKTFFDVQSYYLSRKGEMIQLKKDKKAILSLLSDKKEQLEKFIDQNKLNVKDEAQLIGLISYYNTL